MGSFLTCRVPINRCVCAECQAVKTQHQILEGNLNIIYQLSEPKEDEDVAVASFSITVDVKRIKYIHEDKGSYCAKAQMAVFCPKCDKEHEIEQIIDAPKLFFEKSKKCDSCGGNLTFQEIELEIEDKNGVPFVYVSGRLICEKCNKHSSISANAEISDSKPNGEMANLAISCGKGNSVRVQF